MANVLVRVQERVFQRIFEVVKQEFQFSETKRRDFQWGYAEYEVAGHLLRGWLQLQPGSIFVRELDIKWRRLRYTIAFDRPEICVGGQCLVTNPITGECKIRAPRWCIFGGNPDFTVTLSLDGLLSEISFSAIPDFELTPGSPGKWELYFRLRHIDIDLIDPADLLGDFLQRVGEILDNALSGWPGWARRLVLRIIGGVEQLVRTVFDIPDDIGEFLANLLGVSLGLINSLGDYFGNQWLAEHPFYELENPYPVEGANVALRLPIDDIGVEISSSDLTLAIEVGA